ncbi:MAG: RNA polymerase subunit sigma [Bacteroidales bacterium]|jgi:hypothetical protein|nr:RNA polymerase subunit sigma [Bacteroidales bacterium]
MDNVQTRKDEVKFTTSNIKEMFGKFLSKRVLNTWKEDFVDESSGEIVTIERNEVLFEKGKYIDNDLLTQINFSLQSGEIQEVEVSNQRRLATHNKRNSLWPFKINAVIGGKNYAFILQAQSVTKAIEVATDYIELNYTSGFDISGVKALKSFIILNDRFKKRIIDSESNEEVAEVWKNEEKESNDGEEKRDDTKYYKIEAKVEISSDEDEETEGYPYDFLVKTKDVDTAKVVITSWINNKFKEKGEDRIIELSILSATPFPCNSIIEKEFCLAYFDSEEK